MMVAMKHLSVLIKPASSLCNLRCQYCFYADISDLRKVRSFGIMQPEVMEKMVDHIYDDLEDGDHMTFAFQGGEPTLAGLSYFDEFVTYVKTKNPAVYVHYAFQTNGILIDKEWCEFFKEHQFLVGLSIDGGIQFHDHHRLDAKGAGTYERAIAVKRLFDAYEVEYNILCVLTNQNARHPQKIFRFILKNNIRHIQFVPCLDGLEVKDSSPYVLQPEQFAHFYKQLYPLWKKEFERGNYISIGLFDHILNLLAKGIVGSCGMLGQCQIQYVIEANGNVYPCDFYVLDEFCLGNITDKRLMDIRQTSTAEKFLVDDMKAVSDYCRSCPFFKICRGGCKRMKHTMYLNEAETYCGYQDFLKSHHRSLQAMAQKIRSY